MRRTITTVYLVVQDGSASAHCEWSGHRSWFAALRSLSSRVGDVAAIDEYGRRVATARASDDMAEMPTVTDRNGDAIGDEAGASAAVALTEQCSTAVRAVMFRSQLAIASVSRWHQARMSRGEDVPPWKVCAGL